MVGKGVVSFEAIWKSSVWTRAKGMCVCRRLQYGRDNGTYDMCVRDDDDLNGMGGRGWGGREGLEKDGLAWDGVSVF